MNKIKTLEIKRDSRGKLIEIFKWPGFGQVFYATSKPGVVRGNHYHKRKLEKFCVIKGQAKIRLKNRKTGEVQEILTSGEKPQIIEILPYFTHNIENVGQKEMQLIVWVNEVFDPQDPDTFPEEI